MNPAKVKNILIIFWSPYGDNLVLEPLFEHLSASFPGAKITYLVGKALIKKYANGAVVFKHNPHVYRCLESSVSAVRALLLSEPFDLMIDLCGNRFTKMVCHISGARLRVWGDFRGEPPAVYRSRRKPDGTWSKPVSFKVKKNQVRLLQFLRIARALGIKVRKDIAPSIYLSPQEQVFNKRFLKRYGSAGPLIGMHPGSHLPLRLWSPRKYGLLADRLIDEFGAKVVLFFGPGERWNVRLVQKAARHKLPGVLNTDIRRYLACLSACRLFISTDGGPLHMALALKVPSIGIFKAKTITDYWYAPVQDRWLNRVYTGAGKGKNRDLKEVLRRATLILKKSGD
jgi:ADP-heptose:LPS heptosyltransferase